MGIGNHVEFGDPYTWKNYAGGLAFGAISGGLIGGVSAKFKGVDFWHGTNIRGIPKPEINASKTARDFINWLKSNPNKPLPNTGIEASSMVDEVLYKNIDELINSSKIIRPENSTKVEIRQLFGDADDIINQLAEVYKATPKSTINGWYGFTTESGLSIGHHFSTSSGTNGIPTLTINKFGEIFKIRIFPR